MTLKAILVDDEFHALDLFKKVLALFPNNLEILGEASSLPEALKLIEKHQPQVVFLDVDMPKYSGLQISDFIEIDRSFEIVFVTAHSSYAIDAIRIPAFDYLLKPIDSDKLEECIKRLNAKFKGNSEIKESVKSPTKLVVNTHQGTHYIEIEDINFIEASSMYSIVHINDEQIVVSRPLSSLEEQLDDSFFRIHRSFIVNGKQVKKFSNLEGSEVELKNGKKVQVARTKRDEFKLFMKRSFGF